MLLLAPCQKASAALTGDMHDPQHMSLPKLALLLNASLCCESGTALAPSSKLPVQSEGNFTLCWPSLA